ncbi:hypothetical protein A2154_02575 [Candidatus Gottesmanbacteria bacterium RBG_16_43_7]|uniref:Type II secretion system protein GspG C-terminal domain-containing protein n=1 Tax=Candidatus Gottesmanbacteria bacterium RBG_16_43_7 TaxID=1798373 RepID=A0A1F5ZDV5_9BACT|nr:MAG: hypothetical protein A2154_02575 [Candidatus Gottesmanbacteria bacterium RBG_16_43_7]
MRRGFTLIELLVVIGIIGILAAVVLVAINPARQFAATRDTQRRSDLYSLTNALYQYAAEHNGLLPAAVTTSPTRIGTDPGLVDLKTVLVPVYLPNIPEDPTWGDEGDTFYTIYRDINNRITATAASELNPGTSISIIR